MGDIFGIFGPLTSLFYEFLDRKFRIDVQSIFAAISDSFELVLGTFWFRVSLYCSSFDFASIRFSFLNLKHQNLNKDGFTVVGV